MKTSLLTLVLVWRTAMFLAASEPGFAPLFDGRTLNGWAATNQSYWSVSEGALTAGSTNPIKDYSYLIWQGGRPADFELKLKFRIQGDAQANAGVQFRSTVRSDGFVEGYQADIARYEQHCGILYDETPKRGLLAQRGQRVWIDPQGERQTKRFAPAAERFGRINLDDWNEYHVLVRGPHTWARINGHLMWSVTDLDAARRADAPGVIALQLHSGPPMKVQFKDLELKPLPARIPGAPLPFFAFCMDTHDTKKRSLQDQAQLLKELGYAGAGHLWLDQVPERLQTLEAAGLELFQVYFRVNIGRQASPPYDPRLKEVLPLLKGRNTMLAVIVQGGKSSDETGDARALELLREIADLARAQGVPLALYPHVGDWLERVEDGLRLVWKMDRPNVGVMFNLCHWLKVDAEKNLRTLLQLALPHLLAVSINGADHAADIQDGKGQWLQPLDRGEFDQLSLLKMLHEFGYAGPVGLQCYGIGGDARDHLTRSMAAWRQFHQRLREGKGPGTGD